MQKKIIKIGANKCFSPILMTFIFHTFWMIQRKNKLSWRHLFYIFLESSEMYADLSLIEIRAKLNFSSQKLTKKICYC